VDIDSFINAKTTGWRGLEEACRQGNKGLSKLSGPQIQETLRLYLSTSADLSEVQTRYRDPQLTAYLSRLVAMANSALYSARPRTTAGLMKVFGARYRKAFHETRPFILIAAAILFVAMAATFLWVATSPAARAGVLPPQAKEALKRAGGRRPDFGMAPASLSALIFVNNARVAILAFAFGVTFGIGTIFMLISNGFIVGALGAGAAVAGKGHIFWSLIIPHGLLELTAICIAAGAGLRMGWSLAVPGDQYRGKALAEASAQAVVLLVGVIPAFVIAALIEGLLTGGALPSGVQITVGVVVEAAYAAFLFWPSKDSASAATRVALRP